MRSMPVFVLLAIAFLTAPVFAQVYRCKDMAGKLNFTDAPCTAGQDGALIQRQQTQGEIRQERVQAYNAETKKLQRNMIERERERQEQWRSSQAAAQSLAQPVQPAHKGYAERMAERNAQVSAGSITNNGGRWDQAAEAQRMKQRHMDDQRDEARRQVEAASSPRIITNCNGSACFDDQGGVYNRSGPDFMVSPSGRTCHRAGNMWNCN